MTTTRNGQGTLFTDPANPRGNNVRVQSGNPNNSPNPLQQNPYVRQTVNGRTVDSRGNPSTSPTETHIPKSEFNFLSIMEVNNKIWEKNIVNSIKDLSDIELQKLSWLGKDKNNISSFTEVLGMLYDTFGFEDYIKYSEREYGRNNIYYLLKELDRMISNFQDIGYHSEKEIGGISKILHDSRWLDITKKAKEAYELLKHRI